MKFEYRTLEDCHEATGTVIVVDVIRAFTNAAFAFSRGVSEIYPVSGVEEALALKAQHSDMLASGEVGGFAPPGFDLGNSPTETSEKDLTGKRLVQRTGAGTQGIVHSKGAGTLLAASFVVAGATVRHVKQFEQEKVTFVITGQRTGNDADEDLSCAEYVESLLRGEQPDPAPYLLRVRQSREAQLDALKIPLFYRDMDRCAALDTFNFAMPVTLENGHYIIRAVPA